MEKKPILEIITIDEQDIPCNLEEFITKLTSSVPENYLKDARVEILCEEQYGYIDTEIEIRYHREETDEEYRKRMTEVNALKSIRAINKAKKERQKEIDEKKLYEELKKKYE